MSVSLQIQSVIYHNEKESLKRALQSLANAVRVNRNTGKELGEVFVCYGDASSAPIYTEEEIADMLKCDQEIDRGADLFPLDPELEKGAKKARRADRTDTPKPRTTERKPNEDKQNLLHLLQCGLGDNVADLVVTNQEREFLFTYQGTKYKVVLSCPRT